MAVISMPMEKVEPSSNRPRDFDHASQIGPVLDRFLWRLENEDDLDGQEPYTREQVSRIVDTFGSSAIQALDAKVRNHHVSIAVCERILVAIGYVDSAATEAQRIELLSGALIDLRPGIRLAAVEGLEAIGSDRVLDVLRNALVEEEHPWVRESLQRGLSTSPRTDFVT